MLSQTRQMHSRFRGLRGAIPYDGRMGWGMVHVFGDRHMKPGARHAPRRFRIDLSAYFAGHHLWGEEFVRVSNFGRFFAHAQPRHRTLVLFRTDTHTLSH